MQKRILIVLTFFISILLSSCSEETSNPTTYNASESTNLSKTNTGWVSSSILAWPTYSTWDPLYQRYNIHCYPDFYFSFNHQ